MREGAWLVVFLFAQRLVELCFAQFNTGRLRAQGGVEFGAWAEQAPDALSPATLANR